MPPGVARGAGWQELGAVVNLATFYCVGVPVGVLLAFRFNWDGKVCFSVPNLLSTGLSCFGNVLEN